MDLLPPLLLLSPSHPLSLPGFLELTEAPLGPASWAGAWGLWSPAHRDTDLHAIADPCGLVLEPDSITAEGVVGDLQGVWQGAVVQHDFGGEFLQQRGSMWGWASCCLAAVVWIPLSHPFPVSVHQEPGAGRSVPGTSTGLPGPQAHPPERQLWELLEAP